MAVQQIDKKQRAEAIKQLTNNGKKRKVVRDLNHMMSNDETLGILNALFAACAPKQDTIK
ncbi:MAG TPA: hypothetical protein DDY18_09015 [Flavobacterium sp.]|nr:hypothetical protein [Flavobacterium sp.]